MKGMKFNSQSLYLKKSPAPSNTRPHLSPSRFRSCKVEPSFASIGRRLPVIRLEEHGVGKSGIAHTDHSYIVLLLLLMSFNF